MPKLAALALAACALLAPPAARAFQPGTPPPEPDPEIAKQKRAVADIRFIGTAMFSWLTDQVGDPEAEKDPATDDVLPCDCDKDGKAVSYDVRDVPEITWEALRAILVPQYVVEIPRDDPWGNPYEYRLKLDNVLSRTVLSIRSAGSDGRFDTDRYTISGFTMADTGEDLAWADGFFLRWPEMPKPGKAPAQK